MPDTMSPSRLHARFDMPEQLRADVRLLGELLGEVIRGYGGQDLLDDVELLRALAIQAHGDDPARAEQGAAKAERLVARWPVERADMVARAFTCYFHLSNLAEEYHRVRVLRERDSVDVPYRGSLAEAVDLVAKTEGRADLGRRLAELRFHPVLTAHPTEARRTAVSGAIRRISTLLAERDDPRLGSGLLAENRRRLLEQIDVLWRTAPVRAAKPSPLDEVRTAMAVFDATLFDVLPRAYRRLDDHLAGAQAGLQPPQAPAFVRLGSWIGADRDGNPNVTATMTQQAIGIQTEHVLAALERSCTGVAQALTVDDGTTPPDAAVRRILQAAGTEAPALAREVRAHSGGESHRAVLLLAAARLAATRRRDADLAFGKPAELLALLEAVQASLAGAGANRQAYGALQELIWQVQTFGFHLAELEVRQHSKVHAQALAELRADAAHSPMTDEVLATFRVMAQIQQRFGVDACRRYVVSFTRNAADLAAVRELAGYALDGQQLTLDVVPLFETEDDLLRCVDVVEETITFPAVRRRLEQTGRHYEIMLGYSDSAKDVGPASATLVLYDAQARLAEWARRREIKLTLFHGRGGALGRGGGPANRAVLAQAPGSVDGRFKVTEQGEVIFARYGDPDIALRHIEQVGAATLLASTPAAEARTAAAAERYAGVARTLGDAARAAYHQLVHADGFAEWFTQVTPLEEIGQLQLGSRPARRGLSVGSLEDLRCIPWVFAWTQARVNLTGWYGLGSGLAAVGDVDLLARAYAEWPLFSTLVDNVEMSLAKADPRIARSYLDLGGRPELTEQVLAEHARTTEWVLKLRGHERLLEDRRVLGRAVELRNPYVDALSYLQVRALRALRSAAPDTGATAESATAAAERRLLLLTVNGVAAGLQNTG